MLVCVIVQNDTVTISESEATKLSNLVSKVTGTVCPTSNFVDLTKTSLNFAIAFEKDYHEKFVTTRIVGIVKDMVYSDFLTGMSAQSYF